MRSRTVAVALAGCLLLGACGSDDPTLTAAPEPSATTSPSPAAVEAGESEPTAATATATDSAVATATPAPSPESTPTPNPTPSSAGPSPTAIAAPTATPRPAPECTAPLVGPAANLSTSVVDIDDDGATDVLSVYSVGPPSAPTEWRIRVETDTGASFDDALAVEIGGVGGAEAVGGGDVDGDGVDDELFTVVGFGASATIVAIHARVGCDLVQVGIGGVPVAFPIGGSVGSIGGAECVDTDADGVTNVFVAYSGVADFDAADGTYVIDAVEYRLVGTSLEQVGSRQVTANVAEADFRYASLNCTGVFL